MAGGGPGAMPPDVSARLTLSIDTPGGGITVIPYDVEVYKTKGITHSNILNQSHIGVVKKGKYRFGANISPNAATTYTLGYRINGAGSFFILESTQVGDNVSFATELNLAAGDFIEIFFTSAGSIQGVSSFAFISRFA